MVSIISAINEIVNNDNFRCFACERELQEENIIAFDLDNLRIHYNCSPCSNVGWRSVGAIGYSNFIEYIPVVDDFANFDIISGGSTVHRGSRSVNYNGNDGDDDDGNDDEDRDFHPTFDDIFDDSHPSTRRSNRSIDDIDSEI